MGIQGLAIPALGCGLGGLNWEEVGPVMCKYLTKLDIPVEIYLPAEKTVPPELLTKEFLLKN
jgi:O-acetyl-ADP-ribose deacetylase (regulator of RNase III)